MMRSAVRHLEAEVAEQKVDVWVALGHLEDRGQVLGGAAPLPVQPRLANSSQPRPTTANNGQ